MIYEIVSNMLLTYKNYIRLITEIQPECMGEQLTQSTTSPDDSPSATVPTRTYIFIEIL